MPLSFLADHCVSSSIIDELRKAGHTVTRLKDCLRVESPDREVISKAQELKALLLSLNGDFADIVTYPPSEYGGIISLQVRNHPAVTSVIIGRLIRYLSLNPEPEHYRRKLFIVEPDRIRIRE